MFKLQQRLHLFYLRLYSNSLPILDVASKILKKTAIPSIFPWKNASQPPTTCKEQDSSSYTAPEPDEHQEPLALNISQIQRTYARSKHFFTFKNQIMKNVLTIIICR